MVTRASVHGDHHRTSSQTIIFVGRSLMHTPPLSFIGIAGSLRQNSYSLAVLEAIATLLPENSQFSLLNIGDLPHYNQDLDLHETPTTVVDARAAVADCDAVIITVPEYNHGIPGVLKNVFDWLSRPAFGSAFADKPVFFVTLSEGSLGGVRAQSQLRQTLAAMQCRLPPLPEMVVQYVQKGTVDGVFADERIMGFVSTQLKRFLAEIPLRETRGALK